MLRGYYNAIPFIQKMHNLCRRMSLANQKCMTFATDSAHHTKQPK